MGDINKIIYWAYLFGNSTDNETITHFKVPNYTKIKELDNNFTWQCMNHENVWTEWGDGETLEIAGPSHAPRNNLKFPLIMHFFPLTRRNINKINE